MRTYGGFGILVLVTLALVGCGGGGGPQKHVATQPNGPPKPPPPKEEALDSERHRKEALAAATAFAQKKYAAKLDYGNVQCFYSGAVSKKVVLAPDAPQPVPGTWSVMIKLSRVDVAEANLNATSAAEAQDQGGETIFARRFIVDPQGKVREDTPLQTSGIKAAGHP